MQPGFLELEEQWVDDLLFVEQEIFDDNGLNYIMLLFKSNSASNINFSSKRFKKLLNV